LIKGNQQQIIIKNKKNKSEMEFIHETKPTILTMIKEGKKEIKRRMLIK